MSLSTINAYESDQLSSTRNNLEKIRDIIDVKPLPDSLLNFVFYFGSLHQKDERAYIKNILANAIFDAYQDKYIENTTQLISDVAKFKKQREPYMLYK